MYLIEYLEILENFKKKKIGKKIIFISNFIIIIIFTIIYIILTISC